MLIRFASRGFNVRIISLAAAGSIVDSSGHLWLPILSPRGLWDPRQIVGGLVRELVGIIQTPHFCEQQRYLQGK
ncbi:MAG: hypothetical protein ACK5Q5_19765 [Planctomycetaceae bacterium]